MARKRSNSIRFFYRRGVLNASWYAPALKRVRTISLRTSDPTAAYAMLQVKKAELGIRDEMAREFETPLPPMRPEGPLSVRQALVDYYQEHVLGSGKVADKVRQEQAITHLTPGFRNMLLRDVDIPACRAYRDARRSGRIGGRSRYSSERRRACDATIRRELAVLRAAANHDLRWKRISQNEMPTFELPSGARRPVEQRFFTQNQVATLFFEAQGAFTRDMTLLCYYLGARYKAVFDLLASQVHLDRDVPFIELSKPGELATTKVKPKVPIFPQIRAVIARRLAAALTNGGRLFGEKRDFYLAFKKLCHRLGFSPSNPHALRHSRATHLMMAGVNPYKVAGLLGDTVSTIERVYGHHSPEFFPGEDYEPPRFPKN